MYKRRTIHILPILRINLRISEIDIIPVPIILTQTWMSLLTIRANRGRALFTGVERCWLGPRAFRRRGYGDLEGGVVAVEGCADPDVGEEVVAVVVCP
jgi:hypothetical protein